MKEFDETTSLISINSKNSISTSEDKVTKVLVNLDYDVRKRIDGVLELKVAIMKYLDFKVMGHSRLRGWLDIFAESRIHLHTFPFFAMSNEVVLQLKTKY
jgi:hypothetical protein